jgi:predicted phosphodiesterase
MGPVLYCGDPHGSFDHIVEAALHADASAVVLLGDLEPRRPLHMELQPIRDRVWWIPGNHNADSDDLWTRVWGSALADRNVHGRVVTLPNGTRLAGLGGIFRESVWHPSPAAARGGHPAYRSREEHAASTPPHERWRGGHARKHWGTIYADEVDRLSELQVDVLVTHEARRYHPYRLDLLDTLAREMGVRALVHGHHHDRLDSSSC